MRLAIVKVKLTQIYSLVIEFFSLIIQMLRLSMLILLIFAINFLNGNNVTAPIQNATSTRKPFSIKLCGKALVKILDIVCQRTRQLILKKEQASSPAPASTHEKRHMLVDDDLFTRTLSFTDYARMLLRYISFFFLSLKINMIILFFFSLIEFNNTLIGDCCLQACNIKTLIKYC